MSPEKTMGARRTGWTAERVHNWRRRRCCNGDGNSCGGGECSRRRKWFGCRNMVKRSSQKMRTGMTSAQGF